jgi:tRNA guanosine-2'-O-methyltransferase
LLPWAAPSLRTQIPNLGGLARTAEIFGASGLVVSDARVAGDVNFQALSVTAERWVPLVEVSEVTLIPWLLNRRAEG